MITEPPANVHCTWVQLRGASVADPGEIALIYYVIDGAAVSLTDTLGHQLKDSGGFVLSGKARLGENHATVAKLLARRAGRSNGARTGVPLFYVDTVIV